MFCRRRWWSRGASLSELQTSVFAGRRFRERVVGIHREAFTVRIQGSDTRAELNYSKRSPETEIQLNYCVGWRQIAFEGSGPERRDEA